MKQIKMDLRPIQLAKQRFLYLLQGDGMRGYFAVRYTCLICVYTEVGLLVSEGGIRD